ncbi:O-glucosyltransferase rumi homolog [Coffea eugenioides]|uniref:O-glucosyltransferase rumi homolog n=1 Tax=Coffea eugenioides TaxID=49369 RepID=UPI000F60AD90|nr:O-glucosyltransferase rumi homolog [Coffea eugenioides]
MREQVQSMLNGSGQYRHSAEKIGLPRLLAKNTVARSSLAIFFLILLCIGAFFSTRFLDSSATSLSVNSPKKSSFATIPVNPKNHRHKLEIPLNCSLGDATRTCPPNYYPSKFSKPNPYPSSTTTQLTCPDYFRWIHEDLWPWRETGITRAMVKTASKTANFRLVILNGTAYVETYQKAFQSRDTFTLWGILQLLRRYPGQVPDLDLMFDCVDWPVIKKDTYHGPNATAPPPLFRYCGDDTTLDIVFPDWSFWGWPEINVKPWEALSKDLKRGNERSRWVDREPYAYWKGNPHVAETRMDLLKCNASDKQDWGARVYAQDWIQEQQQGYKQSDLASQCIHKYKIYIEGSAWSVSEKYILACDSVTLVVKPRYYDFFTRGLMPLQHYWPIRDDGKCRSIKYAVDWGSSNEEKAQTIGKAASKFVQDELKMDFVYDYMFHLLNGYAKLLKYKPSVPPKAIELCSELMACPAKGFEKKFMMDSTVRGPSSETPCVIPPPYDPATFHSIIDRKQRSIKQAETWEQQYWDHRSKRD